MNNDSTNINNRSAVALITAHGWVGVSTPVIMTATFLAQQGYQVDLFISEDQDCNDLKIAIPELNNENIDIILSRETIDSNATMIWQGNLRIRYRDIEFATKYKIPPRKYDWLIGFDPLGLIRAGLLSFSWRVPYVYHSLELYDGNNSAKEAECWFSQKALLSLTQDSVRADILSDINRIDRKKIEVSYNSSLGGVLKQKKDFFRTKFNLPKNKKIVLATGTLLPIHSIDKIVNSIDKWPDDWILVLHGWIPDKSFESEILSSLEQQKSRLFLSTEIMAVEEKDVIFQSVDVGLVFFEPINTNYKYAAGSAGKLYDFMRAGVPIIGNDIPGMRELLENNGCGIVVKEADKIGDALSKLSSNYSTFQNRCLDNFPEYEFGQCYTKILRRVLAEIAACNQIERNCVTAFPDDLPMPAPGPANKVAREQTTYGSDQLRENDILIASFPRSGNSWTRNLLTDIIFQVHNIETDTNSFDDVEKVIPDIYLGQLDNIDSRLQLPFRLIKTHEKFNPLVQKTVYVFRKASDALCSYYHFCVNFEGLDPKKRNDDFCLEKCDDWARHIDSYLRGYNKSKANICFISYEWLHQDTVSALMTMADFLGLSVSRQMCARAVENQKFQKHRSQSKTFYRRGIVGSSAEELRESTVRQIQTKSESIYDQSISLQAETPGTGSTHNHRQPTGGLRVVHLCVQDCGGAGRAAYRLHKGLEKIGVDSTMLVLNKLTPDASIKVLPPAEGIELKHCIDATSYDSPLWRKQLLRWQKLLGKYPQRPYGLEMFTDVDAGFRLEKIKEIQEADIVHLHWVAGLMDFEGAPAAFGNTPVVWTLHDMNSFTGGCHFSDNCTRYVSACHACPQLGTLQEGDLAADIWQTKHDTYQQLNLNVVCPSHWLANCAGSSDLLSGFPISVIPNGLSTDVFKPYPVKKVRRILEIEKSAKVVLFGADFIKNRRKGFTLLLDALKEFALKDDGNNIILACFGNIPASTSFDLPFPILQLGYFINESDLALIYSAADVFVLPSLEDNLPNTVMEAMACGVPVVGFDVGGLPDMIDHKKNGYLVKKKDARGLSEGICWVLAEEKRRLSLSENSRRKVETSYAHEEQAKAYCLLYEKLLNSHRHATAVDSIGSDRTIPSTTAHHSKRETGETKVWDDSDTSNVIRRLSRKLKDHPEDIEALTTLGCISLDLKRFDEAEIFFRKVLDVDPLNSVAKEHLDRQGDYGRRPDFEHKARRQDYDDAFHAEYNDYMVTAIVSTFNAERFIRGCLEDLESQTIADRLEIVVIDSCSDQNERAIVEEFKQQYENIKYIRTEKRESVYAAWNRGIKIAHGKYVTNANTDDRHCPDAFERMANILERRPDIALVYADAIKTETANEYLGRHTKTGIFHWYDWDRDVLLNKGCFIGPQPMWRRSVHDVYGFFDESLISSGDYEFWLRISQTHDFFHLKMPLGLYHDRPDSIEHHNIDIRREEDQRILSLYRQAAENGLLIRCPNVEQLKKQTEVQNVNHAASPGSTIELFKKNEVPTDQGDLNKMTTNIASQISVNKDNGQDLSASLQTVLEIYPDHAPAHHDLGGAYYQNGDNDNALAHFEKAVAIDPDNADYQKSLADFYYSVAGRVEEALALYSKVLAQQPRQLEALLMAGHISVSLQKFDDAAKFYQLVLEIEPWNQKISQLLEKLQNRPKSDTRQASAEQLYADIQAMVNDGRANEAVSALEKLLELHPDFALAHNDLGVIYYQQGDTDKSLNCYEAAARLEPGNITFQKNLADFYYVEQGRMEDAMHIYVKVLENDPDDIETLMIMGHLCVALQKFEDAESFYNRLMTVEPWNVEARDNLAKLAKRPDANTTGTSAEEQYEKIQILIDNGDDAAVGLLEDFLISHPQHALAHNDLGVFYYNRDDKEKALDHYEQAVRLAPHNLNFQKNLADLYFVEGGRVEDALAIYKDVLAVDPMDVEALMSIGLICEGLARPEDARHFYNRVLEAEPWNADARDRLDNL